MPRTAAHDEVGGYIVRKERLKIRKGFQHHRTVSIYNLLHLTSNQAADTVVGGRLKQKKRVLLWQFHPSITHNSQLLLRAAD